MKVCVFGVGAVGGQVAARLSMLQDVLQGRPIEVEVHLGQTRAFAREKGIAVPTIDTLLALLRGRDRALRQARVN